MYSSKLPGIPIKDELIQRVITETQMNEEIVTKVVEWITKDTKNALTKYNSVELSGFGHFAVYPKRVYKKLEVLYMAKAKWTQKLSLYPEDIKVKQRLDVIINAISELEKRKNDIESK